MLKIPPSPIWSVTSYASWKEIALKSRNHCNHVLYFQHTKHCLSDSCIVTFSLAFFWIKNPQTLEFVEVCNLNINIIMRVWFTNFLLSASFCFQFFSTKLFLESRQQPAPCYLCHLHASEERNRLFFLIWICRVIKTVRLFCDSVNNYGTYSVAFPRQPSRASSHRKQCAADEDKW